jgi:hypothetical protein
MHRLHTIRGCAAACALLPVVVLAPPAAADTQPLHLGNPGTQFTSFTCLNDSCSLAHVTLAGEATSNLATGLGSFHADLIVDFSPGGSCNIVDESSSFIFKQGTIFVHSNHEDCATNGLRIDTTFQVTGGSDAFHGATGGGEEFSAAASAAPANWNGTISF